MKNFEKLKAKWNQKLVDSGFTDIENADGSLKREGHPQTIEQGFKDGRAEYYNQAQEFLNGAKFSTLIEFTIWKMHTEGISFRDIAAELGLTFYKARNTVIKFQKLAGLRKD